MMNEIRLYANDEYDQRNTKTKYHLTLSCPTINGQRIIYTNNPIAEIHKLYPKIVYIDPVGMDGDIVALYVNTVK